MERGGLTFWKKVSKNFWVGVGKAGLWCRITSILPQA